MNNIAFSIGQFTITWYGILVAAGFLSGYLTACRRAPKAGISSEQVSDVFTWIIIGGILGARFMYVVSYFENFQGGSFWDAFKIWEGGLVFFGGLIGGTLAVILFCRFQKIPILPMGDVLAPSLSLGHGFGRLGCLMSGCCYGKACELPWAISFPFGHSTHPMTLHPVQVYESLLNFTLFALLVWAFHRHSKPGRTLGIYCIGYSIIRFTMEFFRGDYADAKLIFGIFTQAHWISLPLFGLGLWLILHKDFQISKKHTGSGIVS